MLYISLLQDWILFKPVKKVPNIFQQGCRFKDNAFSDKQNKNGSF